jgi:hypothetical protein
MVDRLALSFLLILPLALTDFRMGPLDAPVRMSGIAILFLCWLAIGLRQHGAGLPREILTGLATLAAAMLGAGAAVAALAGLDARTTVQVVAVFAAAILLAQVHLGLRQVRRDAGASGLLHYLATAPTDDPEAFLQGLRRVGPTARAALLAGPTLGDSTRASPRSSTPTRSCAQPRPCPTPPRPNRRHGSSPSSTPPTRSAWAAPPSGFWP